MCQAQTIDLTANVPFEFRMDNGVMPAGEYTVQYANHVLLLKSTQAPRIARMSLTASALRMNPAHLAELQFKRYGETYFLSEVWTSEGRSGAALFPTRLEKELASRSRGDVQRAVIALNHK
jgi:hypothetical protein